VSALSATCLSASPDTRDLPALDLNPVLVGPGECVAVDWRIGTR
jgi:hypothetical protein